MIEIKGKKYDAECPTCGAKCNVSLADSPYYDITEWWFRCPSCRACVIVTYLPDKDDLRLADYRRKDYKFKISSFLKALCEKHSLSQRQLAAKIGCKPTRISAWINMKEEPRIDAIVKIAEFGRISIDDLIVAGKLPQ